MRIRPLLCLLVVLLGITACESDHNSNIPNSSGKPGELIMVMPTKAFFDNEAGRSIRAVMGGAEFGLPQDEPHYRSMTISEPKFSRTFKTHRNILIGKISNTEPASVEFQKNKWARNQVVVSVTAPSEKELATLVKDNQDQILEVFDNKEVARLISRNKSFGPKDITNKLLKNHQLSLVLQKDAEIAKDEEGFVWIRLEREHPRGGYMHQISQGILIHYQDYSDTNLLSDSTLLQRQDSIHRQYVPGPDTGNYMRVVYDPILPQSIEMDFKGNYSKEIRGLWRMEGRFMGGPFLSFTTLDKKRNRLVTVQGYVYAPEFDKREYLREVEAMIKSLRFPD